MPFQDKDGPNAPGASTALAFRWFLGIFMSMLLAVIGWQSSQINKLRERQDVLIDRVAELKTQAQARADFYVPIIMQNQSEVTRIDKLQDRISERQENILKRLERLERVP